MTFTDNEVRINKEDLVKQSFNVQMLVAVRYPNNSSVSSGTYLPPTALAGKPCMISDTI